MAWYSVKKSTGTILSFTFSPLTFLCFNVRISQLKYCTVSIETVFVLNLVSKHCSEAPKCIKKIYYFRSYVLFLFV
jgi:hypothetical protein